MMKLNKIDTCLIIVIVASAAVISILVTSCVSNPEPPPVFTENPAPDNNAGALGASPATPGQVRYIESMMLPGGASVTADLPAYSQEDLFVLGGIYNMVMQMKPEDRVKYLSSSSFRQWWNRDLLYRRQKKNRIYFPPPAPYDTDGRPLLAADPRRK